MLRVLDKHEHDDGTASQKEGAGQSQPGRNSICKHTDDWTECNGHSHRAKHQVSIALCDLLVIFKDGADIAGQVQDPKSAEHYVVQARDEARHEQNRKELIALAGF